MEKKEAMKILKDFRDKSALFSVRTALDTVFPELAESEDERIRESLLKYLHTLPTEEAEEYIAWLEKQSTSQVRTGIEWVNTIDDACDKRYAEEYAHGEYCHEQSFKWGFQEGVDWLEKQGEAFTEKDVDDAYLKGISEAKQELEKQGEQETLCDKCRKEHPSHSCQDITELGRCAVEHEQKPADKVEPKFHEGDWVFIEEVKGYKNGPFQIKSVDSFGYSFDEYHTIPFMYEDLLSKWTTQDAKDGDVLVSPSTQEGDKECPFIFKEIDKNGIVRHHVALLQNKYFEISNDVSNVMGYANAGYHVPATKEQRDTLMKAMSDAGYTFDFEKKELKKIEQKSADKIKPKFKVGDVVTNKKSKDTVKIVQILHDSYCYSGWDGAATIYSDFSISEQDDWELVELTAWSEEGGSKYSEDDIAAEEKAEYNKGFECGKQRVLKYPEDFDLCKNPAWSKEDENRINRLIAYFEDEESFTAEDDIAYANWLKSLRPQYTWKPSDEQMNALANVCNGKMLYLDYLNSLYQDLKKLTE